MTANNCDFNHKKPGFSHKKPGLNHKKPGLNQKKLGFKQKKLCFFLYNPVHTYLYFIYANLCLRDIKRCFCAAGKCWCWLICYCINIMQAENILTCTNSRRAAVAIAISTNYYCVVNCVSAWLVVIVICDWWWDFGKEKKRNWPHARTNNTAHKVTKSQLTTHNSSRDFPVSLPNPNSQTSVPTEDKQNNKYARFLNNTDSMATK